MTSASVLCGDALTLMSSLPARSIDAILTDLPYGLTAANWDAALPAARLWAAVERVLKPDGVFVTTAVQPFAAYLIASNPKWFRYEWIWRKSTPSGFLLSGHRPLRYHENVLVFSPRRPRYFPQYSAGTPYKTTNRNSASLYRRHQTATTTNSGTRHPTTILDFPTERPPKNTRRHPTAKPVALYDYLVRTYTREGELILDPTAGSGTTILAALRAGRAAIAIEKDPDYAALICSRIASDPALKGLQVSSL